MRKLADIGLWSRENRHSVRHRLLTIALLPMLVILPLMCGVILYRWNAGFDAVLLAQVNDHSTIAHQYLARILERTQEQQDSVTKSARFRDLLMEDRSSRDHLAAFLQASARARNFDFLYLVVGDGRIIASAEPISAPPVRRDWPIVDGALSGYSNTGIDIFDSAELAALSPELAQRARIELVPTLEASPTDRTQETRGMVVHSASAVTLPDGRPAALVGGILLNQNLAFIDTINDLIYHDVGLPQGSPGTATLFLGEVRISTNVRLFEGSRAIGTRVSAPVEAAVLEQGRRWLDSAFVVNDRYISAYEPMLDTYGRRVGMLYVGFLERPFVEAKRETMLEMVVAFLAVVAATAPLFLIWARSIFRPLERMTDTIVRVEGGDLDARTGQVERKDEIGRVARHLDGLLDRIRERDRQMRLWNEELNQRVETRALELQGANRQLEATTQQLILSEKLAAIGQIAAGVAHELNNPVAVVQGNLEVIRDLMGSQAQAAQTEFRLIDEQLHRISEMVTRLLRFAKPQEYAGYSERYDVAEILTDTLPLVGHLLNKKTTIAVEREDHASRLILMNRAELQQILVNLMVNAIYAMPDGGRLSLRTFDRDDGERPGVLIEVADTGAGMTPDVMQRIFVPFFTTKGRGGTGLGLSISQMLVARQDGKISVDSEPGKGTTFAVWLPEAP